MYVLFGVLSGKEGDFTKIQIVFRDYYTEPDTHTVTNVVHYSLNDRRQTQKDVNSTSGCVDVKHRVYLILGFHVYLAKRCHCPGCHCLIVHGDEFCFKPLTTALSDVSMTLSSADHCPV